MGDWYGREERICFMNFQPMILTRLIFYYRKMKYLVFLNRKDGYVYSLKLK